MPIKCLRTRFWQYTTVCIVYIEQAKRLITYLRAYLYNNNKAQRTGEFYFLKKHHLNLSRGDFNSMHLCALCIANKPKNVTRQDLKNAPLCIVYSKEAIKYLLIYLSWSNKAQTAGKKINDFAMLFLAVFAFWAQKWPKNKSKYKIWILNTPGNR